MKKIGLLLAIFGLFLGCLGLTPSYKAYAGNLNLTAWPSASILAVESGKVNKADKKLGEIGEKLDLNNSPLRSFRKLDRFYPTIASMIVGNAPYDKVKDVLGIPGITETQKKLLEKNLENFTVTPSADVYIEGDYRLNTGSYD
ncbi:MAG: photosystem II complex extrinsic protein PsbU [Trichodesmium sp. MAG_R04]|nr:photosystem II complex extrinsic protein PsbU [Trichodesmium sp. MAG_R04]